MATLLTLGMGMIAFLIAVYVLLIVAQWKIFDKAGEPGWKSLIPIYNGYIQFKITWETKYFWIILGLSFLSGILTSCESVILVILGAACSLATLVLAIISLNKLAKAFGHGAGFTIGLLFLPNIFTLILGFGGDSYLGPQ